MENQEIDQVILNYLRGEATTSEIEFLRKWVVEDEGNERIFESAKTYWEYSNLKIKSHDLDAAYAKLKGLNTDESDTPTIHLHEKEKRKFKLYKVAAAIIIIFTIAGMLYFLDIPQEQQPVIAIVEEVVKENPKGQKLTTFLPDGSKVILNSQSKIRYNRPFPINERLVELEGEAFFEVKKDDQKAFRVVADGVSTTALGTSFNVNSKGRNIVEVSLVSGKVLVSKDLDNSVVLNSGKAAVVAQDGEFEIVEFDTLEKIGWKDGILVFKDNTLPEIVTKLEEWYGVNIMVEGQMEKHSHYSFNYNNETLEDVLRGISFVFHFKDSIYGDTVKIFTNSKK